jgi:hypothetical protein
MPMNIDEQVTYLMRGTEYGDAALQQAMTEELRQRLIEAQQVGRPLRVYCGFDPRTTDIHLGHTIPMRKLRQFQELGHEVTFLIGTYTSLIGDPSDKDQLRPQLSPEQVERNARTYAQQAFKILDPDKTLIRYNAEWLSKLNFADLIRLASNFTIQQFLTRENFRLRWDAGDAIYLHETFYALMQGYDAYAMRTDVQVGGTDQLFNIVTAARKVMTFLGVKPNISVIMGILPGTDGEVRMSKSLGNHIRCFARRHVRQGDERARQSHGLLLPPDHTLDAARDRGSRKRPGRWQPAPARCQDETGARDPSIFIPLPPPGQEHFVRVFRQDDLPGICRNITWLRPDRDRRRKPVGRVSAGGRRLVTQTASA